MTDWLNLIQRHLASDPCEGRELKLGAAASIDAIIELEQKFGFSFPDEFRSLYTTYNGYGVVFDNEPAATYWTFRPLEDLESFARDFGDSISETHPSVAPRFFPFYDWSTGDSAGYLMDENGQLLPGIYDFHHERYEFDETQDVTDFILHSSDTIAAYVEKVIAECENAG